MCHLPTPNTKKGLDFRQEFGGGIPNVRGRTLFSNVGTHATPPTPFQTIFLGFYFELILDLEKSYKNNRVSVHSSLSFP